MCERRAGGEAKRAETWGGKRRGYGGSEEKGLGGTKGKQQFKTHLGRGGGGRSNRIDRPDAQKSIEWMRRIRRIQGNLRETVGAFKLKHATMNGGLQLKPSPAGYE